MPSVIRAVCAISLFGLLMVGGCAANLRAADFQGLRQVSANQYEVFYEDHRGVFGSESSLQERVVSVANSLADRQGLVANPLEARQHRVGILGDWAWAYYKFELVKKGDVTLSRGASEITFEADARMSNNFLATHKSSVAPAQVSTPDKYDELSKLDELRKKGVLTEEEFQEQKRRILAR